MGVEMASGIISFTIRPLQEIQIERAYVVAQAAMPDLTLEQFQQECAAVLHPELGDDRVIEHFRQSQQIRDAGPSWRYVDSGMEGCNFTVATDINDHIRGLCYARIEAHPIAGRLFDVPIFIVVSLHQEQEIAARLFAFMKRRAVDARCDYLRVWALRRENWSLLNDDQFRDRWDHGTIYPL